MAASWRLIFFSTYIFGHMGYRFSGLASLSPLSVFHVGPKTRLRRPFLFINFIYKFHHFQLNALKPGIYIFLGSASLLALSIFMCDQNRGYSGHFDAIIDLRLLA